MKVRDIMTTPVETVDVNQPISDVKGKRLRYPVTENGLFYGVITQNDINRKNAQDDEPIKNYALYNAFTTHPDVDVDTLVEAAQSGKYTINFVPVIDHGLVVGCITSKAWTD